MHENNINTNITQSLIKITQSLIKAISETKDILADSVNPFHKSKYASLGKHLEVLKPIFAKHGLAVIQFPIGCNFGNKTVGVRTIILHESGESIQADVEIPVQEGIKGQDAGALITYLRRYALASVAGVATDDDDAELDRITKSPAKSAPKPKAVVPVDDVPFDAPAEPKQFLTPFGDRKGTPLAELPRVEQDRSVKFGDLNYFANRWTPKPFGDNPEPSKKDVALKAEAVRLWQASETSDNVPY